MNKIFDKNMKFLKKVNLSVYNEVKNIDDSCIKVIKGKKGIRTMKKTFNGKEIFIHSGYDPYAHGKHLSDVVKSEEADIIFLFGLGFGYELTEIVKENPGKIFFISEPDLQIFKTMNKHVDFKKITTLNNGVLICMEHEVQKIINSFEAVLRKCKKLKLSIIALPAYSYMYNSMLNEIYDKVKKVISAYRVNFNTSAVFNERWIKYAAENIKHINSSCPVNKLKNVFEGTPGIVVGAGPSLTYCIDELKNIYDKAVIAAAGTGVSVLESNEVKATVLGAIDANEEYRIFEDLQINKDTPLLYSTFVDPLVMDKVGEQRFLMPVIDMDVYVHDQLQWEHYQSYSAFSISNILTYNLAQLGCNPIIFLGQDFCYSRGRNYAEGGTDYEEYSEERLKTFVEATNINGEKVYTIPSFLGMKRQIEDVISAFPNIKFYNGSKDGLKIEGAENIDFIDYSNKNFNDKFNIGIKVKNAYKDYIKSLSENQRSNNLVDELRDKNKKIIDISIEIVDYIAEDHSDEKKIKFIEKKEKEIEKVDFFYVIRSISSHVEVMYERKNYIDKKKAYHLYIVCLCSIMEKTFKKEYDEEEIELVESSALIEE